MTREQFNKLGRGDIICHIGDEGQSLLVENNFGVRVTAVRTFDVTHPDEWKLVAKANYEKI